MWRKILAFMGFEFLLKKQETKSCKRVTSKEEGPLKFVDAQQSELLILQKRLTEAEKYASNYRELLKLQSWPLEEDSEEIACLFFSRSAFLGRYTLRFNTIEKEIRLVIFDNVRSFHLSFNREEAQLLRAGLDRLFGEDQEKEIEA